MPNVSIRKADLTDVSSIQTIAQESWADVYQGIIPASVQHQALEAWYSEAALNSAVTALETALLVAESSEKVIAFAQLVFLPNARASLTRIYVLPEYQRHGVGSKLFAALVQEAKRRSVCRISVSVAAVNRLARTFYEKLAFVSRGEKHLDLFGFPLTEATYELAFSA